MPSSVLDYVILALIFAIIINIFIQMFSKKCNGKEHMEEERRQEQKQEETQQDVQSLPVSINADEAVTKMIESKTNSKCPLGKMEYENDRYIREFVLGGKFNCNAESETKSFSEEEIKQHQKEVLGFGDTVNFSTNAGEDVIDKINEMYTSGNNELVGNNGKKISDIFNGLTQGALDKKKNCKNPDCLIPPIIDSQYKTGSYLTNTPMGQIYSNYNWRYENDNVNNGGKFYDDIEASDYSNESNLVWTK